MRLLFLSHSSADKGFADTVSQVLHKWGYDSVFVYWDDRTGITGGADWTRELYQKLRQAGALIALYTPEYLQSKWCFAELTAARILGKPLIPLRITPEVAIPVDLQATQVIDYEEDRAAGFSRLERALRHAGLAALDSFSADPTRPPYPGLGSFEEPDAAVFFGRQAEIAGALETLQRMVTVGDGGLLLIAGASGSGKSSLLRAGIVPRLRRASARRWHVLPLLQPRQGLSPLSDLRAALASPCSAREEVLARVATICREQQHPDATPVLAIDQLEQLFVDQPPAETAEFLDLLASIAARPSPLVVIGVLRSDFLDRFQTHHRLRDLDYEFYSLGLLPRARFVEIVQGPADVYGLVFEPPSLAQRIANDAGADEALPLVAFALRTLWEPASREGVIRESLYEKLFGADTGGIPGAIGRTASQIVASLKPEEQQALRRAFLQLVRFDVNDKPVRRQARRSDLPVASQGALEKLVNARLLTSYGEGGDRFVDVAHESLFRVWPELAGWIREDFEFHVWHRTLLEALTLWRHDEANTLKGKALLASEAWLKDRPDDLTAEERAFIVASIAARDREARRRRAWVVATAAGVLAALGALIYGLYTQLQNQRELVLQGLVSRARAARAVAVEGDTLLVDMVNRSVLLAVEAVQRRPTRENVEVLTESLALAPRALLTIPVSGDSEALAMSEGGRYLARLSKDAVEVFDDRGGKVGAYPVSLGDVRYLEWAPEAPLLVLGTVSGFHVFDAAGRREIWSHTRVSPDPGSVCSAAQIPIALDGDGKYLAAIDGAAVTMWELPTGNQIRSFTRPEPLCMVSVSPGARYLAMTDERRTSVQVLEPATNRVRTLSVECSDASKCTAGTTYSADLLHIVFSPSGRQLLTSAGADVNLWELSSDEVTHVRHVYTGRGGSYPLRVRFAEDGGAVGVVREDDWAASVSLQKGASPRDFNPARPDTRFRFILDGSTIRDLPSGERVADLWSGGRHPFSYDPRSGRLAVASTDAVSILDTRDGHQLYRYRAPAGARWFESDAAQRFEMLVRDTELIAIDTETATEIGRLRLTAEPVRITFDGGGARVATFDSSGALTVWDLRASQPLWTKTGIPVRLPNPDEESDNRSVRNVSSLAFNQDGSRLRLTAQKAGGTWSIATGGDSEGPFEPYRPLFRLHAEATTVDSARKLEILGTSADGLWTLAHPVNERRVVLILDHSGAVVRRLTHDGGVLFAYFAPDGRSVVTATENGTIRAWLWRASDLIERACAVVGRPELTEDEWRDAFGTERRRPTCRPR